MIQVAFHQLFNVCSFAFRLAIVFKTNPPSRPGTERCAYAHRGAATLSDEDLLGKITNVLWMVVVGITTGFFVLLSLQCCQRLRC